jgi:DNA-directed RNA polymerase omega subunit
MHTRYSSVCFWDRWQCCSFFNFETETKWHYIVVPRANGEGKNSKIKSRPGKALGSISQPVKGGYKNMTGIVEVSSNVPNDNTPAEWPGIVSRFQLVILAAHRNKQLLLGAHPRIAADRLKRRNTSIALEELKRGLILFKPVAVEGAQSMA